MRPWLLPASALSATVLVAAEAFVQPALHSLIVSCASSFNVARRMQAKEHTNFKRSGCLACCDASYYGARRTHSSESCICKVHQIVEIGETTGETEAFPCDITVLGINPRSIQIFYPRPGSEKKKKEINY